MNHFITDKKDRVLVAMTGKMSSTVAAYLLKKQGYSCVGISFSFFDSEDSSIGLQGNCHIKDVNNVKKICTSLDIPFYVGKVTKEYKFSVLSGCIGARLSGRYHSTCMHCHKLLFELLSEKAKILGINRIATGHFAKLVSQNNGPFSIVAPFDQKNDQSYLLTTCKQSDLKKLMLPLSEISKKEVEKICATLSYKIESREHNEEDCLYKSAQLNSYIEKYTAKDLLTVGSINRKKDNFHICENEGYYKHYLGEDKLPTNYVSYFNYLDSSSTVLDVYSRSGIVYVGTVKESECDHVILTKFLAAPCLSVTLPITAYVKKSSQAEFLPVVIYFKANDVVVLELKDKGTLFFQGQFCVLYNKIGNVYKVIGEGFVDKSVDLSYIPEEKDHLEEEEEVVIRTTYDYRL